MKRRYFLGSTFAAVLVSTIRSLGLDRPPRILLRSSWQTVNIGDIAHTPGVLRLLGEYLPEAEITLHASSIADGVKEMLEKNFPKLKFADKSDLPRVFSESDFLLHGSGPGFVGQATVAAWAKETTKPYGIYGITFSAKDPQAIELLSKAQFAYFRDSVSLEYAKKAGVTSPIMEFGPDGAFATNVRDDAAAVAFLKEHGLEEGKFLCVIPRYRNTPYWKIKNVPFDAAKDARNQEMKEHDHAPLRAAIEAVVRETPMKVLICPEDKTQVEIGKEMLFDPLPAEVKAKVVWRDKYWLTDEALSTYVRSAGLFGNEMHSPIMCIGNGIPAIVCRWKEQTTKGFMWRDIGLGEWLFDLDNADEVAKVAPAVLAMAKDPKAAKAKAAEGRAFVEKRQRETMGVVKRNLRV